MNRLQGALLEEAFRLVDEGYATVEDVDIGIRDGLALRWSFMGPFETIDLNAPGGVRDYVDALPGDLRNIFPADAAPRRLGRRRSSTGSRPSAGRRLAEGRARRAPGLARPAPDGAGRPQARVATRTSASERDARRAAAGPKGKVIITCAITGAIHTPTMSPYLPVTPDEIAAEAHRRRRGRRRHPAPPRPRPGDRQARPDAGGLRPLPAAHQAGDRRGHQHHHRRQPLHEGRGARAAGRDLQARGRLAQHGLDELRPLSAARASTRASSSTGRSRTSRRRATSSSATPSRTSSTSCHLLRQRHALRVRVLRHRASLQPGAFRRPRAGQAAVLRPVGVRHSSAASARIPRTSPT